MYIMDCATRRPDPRTAAILTRTDIMRENECATRAAEALAHREDDYQRWADDGGSTPDVTRPETPTDGPVTEDRFGLPVRLVYRRRPTG